MNETITEQDVLRRARQIITPPERWAQGNGDWAGGYCSMAAIYRAAREFGVPTRLAFKAEKRLRRLIGRRKAVLGMVVETWNDAPERTHEEVLRLFDRAIGGK